MRTCRNVLLLALLCGGAVCAESADRKRVALSKPVYHWQFPDPVLKPSGLIREIAGPSATDYPDFDEGTRALQLRQGATILHPKIGARDDYKFSNGDTITVEAWVRCREISYGSYQYILAKGRNGKKHYLPENQNWGFRLAGVDGRACLSFLFRSRDATKPDDGEFHRWTSNRGFPAGKQWHHVALTYTFGKPKSIRGWIDGTATDGDWDLGGATTRPPVVDDDDVFLGSRPGVPNNVLQGALASVALYRHAVTGFDQVRPLQRTWRTPELKAIGKDEVLVEIFQATDGPKAWPTYLDQPLRTVTAQGFALFQLPPTYDDEGSRVDQNGAYLIRLAQQTNLPAGRHEFLLRASGRARITIGDETRDLISRPRIVRDAHGALRARPNLPYPRPRLGTSEQIVTIDLANANPKVVVEALVGDPRGKIQIGELLLAQRPVGKKDWSLLAPTASVPFTGEGVVLYRAEERDRQDAANRQLRERLLEDTAEPWRKRHAAARAYLATLKPVPVPAEPARPHPIDRFLEAKIARAAANPVVKQVGFSSPQQVLELFQNKCVRCHGEKKKKGGLVLTSRQALLKGGDSGPVIVPGQAERSELLRRIASHDPDERMPPKNKRLGDKEILLIHTWIEEGAPWVQSSSRITIPKPLDELTFLRRLHLDTVGVLPSRREISAYLSSKNPKKRTALIDRLLADPRHADHWVSYWQDVLAENPRLVKPSLNNTGPFRWWIHESLLDHKPFDRMVTELVTFAGGTYSGAAGGFKLATQNDVPMAAKAHVLGTAFLGVEMKCARCHDAPFHPAKQEQLFAMAAMLKNAPIKVPTSSSVPKDFFHELGGRKSRIKVTLAPGSQVKPAWSFTELAPNSETIDHPSSAHHLAYQITRPENRRFAQVIVNRLWQRYFGQGLVEPVNDWDGATPSHPDLLDYLAREFVANDYSLRHVSKLILSSEAYRRTARLRPHSSPRTRFFEAPLLRRMTGEQLIDALTAATGVPLISEELTFDVEGWYPHQTFMNLGQPRRAWQFVSLATERDRPSLSLPAAQSVVSFLEAYGWRSNRAEPRTTRTSDPDIRQAGMIGNGLLASWWTRLSDHSDLTALAVSSESVEQLITDLYLQLLTRRPTDAEHQEIGALLAPGFQSRLTGTKPFTKRTFVPLVRDVSWRNHMSAASNRLLVETENHIAAGPNPSDALTPGWRTKLEDVIWALINAPEMQFVP